jgi:hypothetical protein
LGVFYDNACIKEDAEFIWVEYGVRTRGVYPKRRKDAGDAKKCFDNQATVLYKMHDINGKVYYPNIKLFRNGSIQMTGIRSPKDGEHIADLVAHEVNRIRETVPTVIENAAPITNAPTTHETETLSSTEVKSDPIAPPIVPDVHATNFKIRMINCDFGVPFKIRRKKLHQLLISPPYNNACSFQPVDYPGVKLQYYWNNRNAQHGNCRCDTHCFGKGTGDGMGQCKKVTVSIFDSGKILITGANSFTQVNVAYKYICDVIYAHEDSMKKVMPILQSASV